jgi:hypothetical protein
MSYSDRVFQRLSLEITFHKDVRVLKAYISLVLAAKCRNRQMETVYRVLWRVHQDLTYTYLDDLYMLQQDIYEYAADGRDDEIFQLENKILQLKEEYSKIQSLLNEFNQLGIMHY